MITYILKSTLILLFMYALYRGFLGKEKLFVFSRFFLLSSIIFSLIIPLVSVPVNFQVPSLKYDYFADYEIPLPATGPADNSADFNTVNGSVAVERSAAVNISTILFGLYTVVSVFLIIRFARNLYNIKRKRRVSQKLDFGKYEIVLSQEHSAPCCFLKSIFLNRDDYQNNRIDKELISHELEHAKQLHTIDVLFIEVLKIFFWFNPLIYLFDRAIRINHEYLADNAVADQNFDLSAYAHKLVNPVTIRSNVPLTSSSNYSFTKNRIFMMTRSKPGKLTAGIRILTTLILMLPVIILMSFQNQGKEVKGFVVNKYGKHLEDVEISVTGQNKKVTSDAMGHFVIKNVTEEATITIAAENHESRTISPVFTSEMVIRLNPDVPLEELKKNAADFFPATGSRPLIVINGVAEEKLSMADIDPDNGVTSMRIFTNADAVTRFGEKAKNGAVEIITESSPATSQRSNYYPVDSPEFKAKTLVLVDGKVYTGNIKDIPIPTMESMSVRNYSSKYESYGLEGKEKVIEFKTK